MKISILLILILVIKLSGCINPKEFCLNKKSSSICQGEYNLNCGKLICTKDKHSCQGITLFSSLKNAQKNEKDQTFQVKKFRSIISQIKECPKNKTMPIADVCFKAKDCISRLDQVKINNKCKCSGKYYYTCNRSFCGVDKKACDQSKQKSTFLNMKNCEEI